MGTVPATIINGVCSFFKSLLEKMMIEERSIFLENNQETKANGYYKRSINSLYGEIPELKIPRSRNSHFKSVIIPEGKTDSHLESIISTLFSAGVSSRKIEKILEEKFGLQLSHSSISKLSQVAYEEVVKWKTRPLQNFSIIYIDAFFFPLKRNTVQQEAVYVALGISKEGRREVLGFWIPGGSEGASNWEEILNDLKSRGLSDIDYVVADGLTGISEAISRVYPKAKYQYCVLHATRHCLNKTRASDKKEVAGALKKIYLANTREEARKALEEFSMNWKRTYPRIVDFWERRFDNLTSFMDLPSRLWRFVYTTNWIERLHKEIKRRINAMELFQSEISAERILYSLYVEQNKNYQLSGVEGWREFYKMYKGK